MIPLLSDLIYMFLNFKYSYYIQTKERQSMYSQPEFRDEINTEIYNEYGFLRVFIKGFIYYGWFAMGFFTHYWPYHICIFLFNLYQETKYRGVVLISEFSFFVKLSAYLFVYLSIIYSILKL